MYIEIRKIEFINKGAELMLMAILDQMRERYPGATFTSVTTHASGQIPFGRVVGCGMYPKFSHRILGRDMGGDLLGLVPRRFRERYGLVVESEVDVVIDASGYSYGDPFSPRRVMELARAAARWKRQGKKLVLMPQAFGPFSRRDTRRAMRRIVELADLVFARERQSMEYLVELAGERRNLAVYPDFTILVEGELPEGFKAEKHRVALIPNSQMLAKTSSEDGHRYIPFMQVVLDRLVGRSAAPFILIHESQRDRQLAEQIRVRHPETPVLTVESAREIKGVIGACRATIGSRFHGLVSALTQGVPSLATGWSHKYVELFEGYGCREQVLPLQITDEALQMAVDRLLDETTYNQRASALLERAEAMRPLVQSMWERVFATIEE